MGAFLAVAALVILALLASEVYAHLTAPWDAQGRDDPEE